MEFANVVMFWCTGFTIVELISSRNRKYEADLRREKWKIKYDDITFHREARKGASSYDVLGSRVS